MYLKLFNNIIKLLADGFEVVDEAKKIWSATVQATGD